MLETIILELAKQIPALVVLVYLVIVFTKTLKDAIEKFLEFVNVKEKRIEEMADRMNSALERNTAVLEHVKVVLADKKSDNK